MDGHVLRGVSILFLCSTLCFASRKIDLGFLVDDWSTIPSVNVRGRGAHATAAGDTVKDLIRSIYGSFMMDDDSTRVGLIKSGPTANVVFDFNAYNDLNHLDEAVDKITFPKSAESNIGKALNLANYGLFKNSGRPDALKFLVVIAQTKSTDDVSLAARDLRNSGVNILSAWSGKRGLNRDDLQSIASPPKHYNLFRDEKNSVDKLARLIVKRIRYVKLSSKMPSSRTKTYRKAQKTRNKCSKRCDVKVEGDERINIDCSNCKLVGCCDRCCKNENQPFYPGPVELAILLDESGELMNRNNFNKMKSFIKNLAREFEVSNKKTKIGLISFTDANLQLFDLHSYHDRKSIDSQIDKLNFEGIKTKSGALNKALDATQANLFTGERDQSVPRLLFVFDSATKKDAQTEIKAFKLQETDVQTFCIGLGINYDKTGCSKIVEKPYERHSLSARVEHLGELQEAIMLMVVSDIAKKYCPLCDQGNTDACRPCKTARHVSIDDEEDKSLKNIDSEEVLKLLKDNHYKLGVKISDENDDDDENKNTGNKNALKLLAVNQVGTPLPSAEVVKELLQSGTALNPDTNSQGPLIANGQENLLQQNQAPGQHVMIQQPLQAQQPDGNDASPLTIGLSNQRFTSPLLKSAPSGPSSVDQASPLAVQPAALSPSLLSQALLGAGKFQQPQGMQSQNMEGANLENGAGPSSLPLGALSTLPVQDSRLASSLGEAGLTSSLPVASPSTANDALSMASQPQSSVDTPQFQAPQFDNPTQNTNWFGFPTSGQPNKKSPFENEYKYDLHDKEGPYVMACKDLSDECALYATEGGCDEFAPLSNIGQVKTMCKKSCGFCESKNEKGHKKSRTQQARSGHRKKKTHRLS